jgi:membrane-associated phospholipid phosphatase
MFMGAYLSMALYSQASISPTINQHRSLIIPALLALPPMIMYSRVRLGVHTVAQCFVGGLLGLTNAVCCTALWQGWGQHRVGLGRSSWVMEGDEYLAIAQELAREWIGH